MPTSRRTFLGLIAAAPPAMLVKPDPYASLRPWTPPPADIGFLIDAGFTASEAQAYDAMMFKPSLTNEKLRELLRSPMPWDIPNRLYGAAINNDGDAI